MTYLFRMKTFYALLKTHLNKSRVHNKGMLEIGRSILKFRTVSQKSHKLFLLFNTQLAAQICLLIVITTLFISL